MLRACTTSIAWYAIPSPRAHCRCWRLSVRPVVLLRLSQGLTSSEGLHGNHEAQGTIVLGIRSSLINNNWQNLIRQSLFFNYEYYLKQGTGAFENEDHILRLHISEQTLGCLRLFKFPSLVGI